MRPFKLTTSSSRFPSIISRSLNSKEWLKRHNRDQFVRKAKSSDLRSRGAFKLIEIQKKYGIIRPTDLVVDLGAAPGGWSVAAMKTIDLARGGYVVSNDLLPMEAIEGAGFVQGDFCKLKTQEQIMSLCQDVGPDVVISDMLHNTTGNKTMDHHRSLELCMSALDFCDIVLKPGGNFLAKVLRGVDDKELFERARGMFQTVQYIKPKASRSESTEVYIMAVRKLGVPLLR